MLILENGVRVFKSGMGTIININILGLSIEMFLPIFFVLTKEIIITV